MTLRPEDRASLAGAARRRLRTLLARHDDELTAFVKTLDALNQAAQTDDPGRRSCMCLQAAREQIVEAQRLLATWRP